jgi:hypothetical protein
MSQNKNSVKHLTSLTDHLQPNENIISSIFGVYETKRMGNKTIRNGVFALTETRLLFFAKKMFGYDLESFKFDKISSIERSKSAMGHSMTVYTSGNDVHVKWINDGDFVDFMDNFDVALENKVLVAS